ncbi:MAG: endonuclease/exonuclease/phosphatase family protein [Clostridium sp.]
MKIMTFNLRCDFPLDFKNRWKTRKHIIYDIFNKYECDIIGIQESTEIMYEDMKNNINNYNIVGMPRSRKFFSERNDILISNIHHVCKSKTFWLSDTPDVIGSTKWFSIFPRICTTAVIEIVDGIKIRVCNCHLDCFTSKAREYEIRKLIDIVDKEQEKEELPMIIMGDFNSKPDSRLIKNLSNGVYGKKKMTAVQEFDKKIYMNSTMSMFKGKEKGIHIDYIFISEEFEVNNVEIIRHNDRGKYPSDHYPLFADVTLSK